MFHQLQLRLTGVLDLGEFPAAFFRVCIIFSARESISSGLSIPNDYPISTGEPYMTIGIVISLLFFYKIKQMFIIVQIYNHRRTFCLYFKKFSPNCSVRYNSFFRFIKRFARCRFLRCCPNLAVNTII
jgi:hypothetical protein